MEYLSVNHHNYRITLIIKSRLEILIVRLYCDLDRMLSWFQWHRYVRYKIYLYVNSVYQILAKIGNSTAQ